MKLAQSFLIVFLLALAQAPAQAQQALPPAPVLAAKSWLLYDYTSNQILASEKGNERIEPASLTKLMTAYLTFAALKQNRLSLNQTVTPPVEALRTDGEESRMFLDVRKPVTVADLLRGLIVQSGNDAARVLATAVSGNEENFAAAMNKEAQRLGMNNTRFANATGMPHPQHYTTPHDLALMAAAIIRDFPEHYPLYSMREFQ